MTIEIKEDNKVYTITATYLLREDLQFLWETIKYKDIPQTNNKKEFTTHKLKNIYQVNKF